MNRQRWILCLGLVVAIALVTGPGCATKKYVRGEMSTMDQKVESVSTEVEANQKRIKEHDERLASIGELITQQGGEIKAVDGKIEDVRKLVRGELIYKATLMNNNTKFAFGSADLSDADKGELDQFVQNLVQMNRGVYLEIQGHTDNVGPDSVNMALGEQRAKAVMMYLLTKYHIPLYRMQTVSLGSSMPIADNSTREGRAQNRRVEILVYE